MPHVQPPHAVEDLRALFRRHGRPAAVTIGAFDGVHAGHRKLVAQTRRLARARGLAALAVTFSPRPEAVLTAGTALPDLCSLDERVRRLRRAGADDVVVIPFTRDVAAIAAETFALALVDDLGARVLCVGEDFALGRGRAGDVATLRGLGLEVVTPPLVLGADGTKVSSSYLRRRVAEARGVRPLVATGGQGA